MTAEHVVTGSTECIVTSSAWSSKAEVVATAPNDDIAILKLSQPASAGLLLATDMPTMVGPLVCWEDSSRQANNYKNEKKFALFHALKVVGCLPLSILNLRSTQGHARLGLAGQIREGMSGGPVFAPLCNRVMGVVSGIPPYDPSNVIAAWTENGREYENLSDNLGADVEALLRAQLACGIGVAVPAPAVVSLLLTVGAY